MSEAATGFLEGRTCKRCGKHFFVLYPQLWRYVIQEGNQRKKWFCSWGCIQAYRRGKEAGTMRSNRMMDTAVKLVEAMEAGEDAYQFLREQGYASPEKAYQNIKQRCREKDPELAERFPKRYVRKELTAEDYERFNDQQITERKIDIAPKQTEVELVYDPSIADEYRKEQAEKAKAEEKKPVNIINGYDSPDVTVTAIVVPDLGEFYYDRRYRSVDWRSDRGEEVSLAPEDWRKLEKEIQRVMRILGVDA